MQVILITSGKESEEQRKQIHDVFSDLFSEKNLKELQRRIDQTKASCASKAGKVCAKASSPQKTSATSAATGKTQGIR